MPFNRFKTIDGKTVDAILGPEMRSTGEVMGFDADFGKAFAKAQTAAYGSLPLTGRVFVSMANRDKRTMVFPVKRLADLGYEILATKGTAEVLRRNGVSATVVRKHSEGDGADGEQDHRRQDPRRRDRPGREHAARHHERRVAAARRLRDPHGRHPAPTSRASPPCRASAPRCRGSRRCAPPTSGCARCRTGPGADRARLHETLSAALPPALRPGADAAPTPRRRTTLAFRAIRAAQPVTGCVGGRRQPGGAGRPRGDGARLPGPARPRRRLRQERASASTRSPTLGFGFVEIGTVTGEPQPGNPKPRLARLPADRAIVNRMGFNNDGAEVVARRLAARRIDRTGRRLGVPLGINIGKTKVVPEDARDRRLREEHHAARAVRRLPRRQRLLAEHPGPARPAGREPARAAAARRTPPRRRRRRPARAAAREDRPRPRATRTCSRSPTSPSTSGSTASSPPTPRSRATASPRRAEQVEAAGAGGLSGPPAAGAGHRGDPPAARPGRPGPDADRRRRHHHARGRPRAAGRGSRPAAGLHRLRLRGPLVARPDERARSRASRGVPTRASRTDS